MPEHTPKDVGGRYIEIGDIVAFVTPNSPRLQLGRVVKLTPKGASIATFKARAGYIGDKPLNRTSNQVAIISKDYQQMNPQLVMDLFKREG